MDSLTALIDNSLKKTVLKIRKGYQDVWRSFT